MRVLTPDAQQQVQDQATAGAMLKAAQTGATGTTLSAKLAARAATGQAVDQVGSLADNLQQQGLIDQQGKGTLTDAIAAAADPKQVLTGDHLASVAGLGLDPELTSAIGGAMRSTDILSRVGIDTPGPVEATLQAAGVPLAGAALGAIGAGHHGAVVGSLVGSLVKPQIAAGLGRAGAAIDSVFGLGGSPVLKDAASSARLLNAAGVPVPDPSGSVQDATSQSFDIGQAQLAALQRQGQDQAAAIQMNRQHDQDQAAAWRATLADAYGTNAEADKIEAARQQMTTALNARANTADTAGNWMERQAMAKFKGANPDVPVTGAGVLSASTPEQVFQATGGRFGNPAGDPPQMNGVSAQETPQSGGPPAAPQPAPQQPAMPAPQGPSQSPVGAVQPSQQVSAPAGIATPPAGNLAPPGGVSGRQPTASVSAPPPATPMEIAQARAAAQGLLQGTRQPQAARQAAVATMPANLQLLARYLPDWVHGVGSDVQGALAASGMAQPLNYGQVAMRALGQLRDEGAISSELHDAVAGHGGRLNAGFYNALRNRALQNYRIDRIAS